MGIPYPLDIPPPRKKMGAGTMKGPGTRDTLPSEQTNSCENITFPPLHSSFPVIHKVVNVVNFVLLRSEE